MTIRKKELEYAVMLGSEGRYFPCLRFSYLLFHCIPEEHIQCTLYTALDPHGRSHLEPQHQTAHGTDGWQEGLLSSAKV